MSEHKQSSWPRQCSMEDCKEVFMTCNPHETICSNYRLAENVWNELKTAAVTFDDTDPCQTPGCDKPAELEPSRCVDCADQEVEHGN